MSYSYRQNERRVNLAGRIDIILLLTIDLLQQTLNVKFPVKFDELRIKVKLINTENLEGRHFKIAPLK